MDSRLSNFARIAVAGVVLAAAAGCASLVSSAASGFAENLSAAVSNQDDPETVRDGAPAYMLLLDSLIEGNPDDPGVLAAAANLYASYGAVFADDPARASRLTSRARGYAAEAMCLRFEPSCAWGEMTYDAYVTTLDGLNEDDADVVYAYGVATLAWIRTHSGDWTALARLPYMEALLNRYLEISNGEDAGTVNTYLGILVTLRPPALGGEPEKGRGYFERAIDLSRGSDLAAKVEFARNYARPLYERALHDRLLNEVLAADPVVEGYTLTNVLAQRDARNLLDTADDHF